MVDEPTQKQNRNSLKDGAIDLLKYTFFITLIWEVIVFCTLWNEKSADFGVGFWFFVFPFFFGQAAAGTAVILGLVRVLQFRFKSALGMVLCGAVVAGLVYVAVVGFDLRPSGNG